MGPLFPQAEETHELVECVQNEYFASYNLVIGPWGLIHPFLHTGFWSSRMSIESDLLIPESDTLAIHLLCT